MAYFYTIWHKVHQYGPSSALTCLFFSKTAMAAATLPVAPPPAAEASTLRPLRNISAWSEAAMATLCSTTEVAWRKLYQDGSSRKIDSQRLLSWSKSLECFAKQDPGRARQSS